MERQGGVHETTKEQEEVKLTNIEPSLVITQSHDNDVVLFRKAQSFGGVNAVAFYIVFPTHERVLQQLYNTLTDRHTHFRRG